MVRNVHWAQRFSRVVVDGPAAGPEGLLICLMLLGKSAQTQMRDSAEKGGIRVSLTLIRATNPWGVHAFRADRRS
jgi:hypothetical protein